MNSHTVFRDKSRLAQREARPTNEWCDFANMSCAHTIAHFTPFLLSLATPNSRSINENAVAEMDVMTVYQLHITKASRLYGDLGKSCARRCLVPPRALISKLAKAYWQCYKQDFSVWFANILIRSFVDRTVLSNQAEPIWSSSG